MPVKVGDSSLSEKRSTGFDRDGWDMRGYERLKPGPGMSHESVAMHQRERVHRAMAVLVANGGRGAVTVRKLAKLAGVSTATFYSLYDGVDDCLLGASGAVIDEVAQRVLELRAFRSSRPLQVERVLKTIVRGFTDEPAVGRLALIEAFAGGPAALGAMTSRETALETAFRRTLSTRGRPVSATMITWVVAGALQSVRVTLGPDSASRPPMTTSLLVWARSCLADSEPGISGSRDLALNSPRASRPYRQAGRQPDEFEMISAAVERLARVEGYWRLSKSAIGRAAGVPATHLKRYFRNLDDAYLAGVDRVARRILGPLTETRNRGDWTAEICAQVYAVATAVDADPTGSQLALQGVLSPGVSGVTHREALLDEIGTVWGHSVGPSTGVRTRTALAGLWTSLSRAGDLSAQGGVRRRAPTYAYLILAPAVGPTEAAEAVRRHFFRAKWRSSSALDMTVPN